MWQHLKNIYHLIIGVIASILYSFPSRNLIVVGVTGTDGKTTTTSLIYHILNSSGLKASMVSSVGAIIGGKNYDVGFHVTTPSSFALQKFLKQTVDGSKNQERGYMILETTSHALDQHRVFGIKFEVGILTNITHEHLDYHKTYENYVKAKMRLLKASKIAILNKDDESYALIGEAGQSGQLKTQKLITYGLKNNSDINPKVFPFKTSLIGEFNKYNILAAVSACKALGVSESDIRKGVANFSAPIGRADIVYKKEFIVMIDFAHTPNAFDQILSSLRGKVKGRIIHVFGSAGKRDRTKRPLMGEISSRYADIIVLTAEDPRDESIDNIDRDIEKGINSKFKLLKSNGYFDKGQKQIYFKIDDRKDAIGFAVSIAKKEDLVLTTGKSHEKSMNYGEGEVAWSEYNIVTHAISLRKD